MKKFLILTAIFCSLCFAIQAREVVLITGASRGIGAKTADLLANEGYTVYAGMRKIDPNKITSQENLNPILLDVTDDQSVKLAIQKILEREGRIDVLVNNAGVEIYGSMENVTIEEAKQLFDVNFFGAMRVTQAVLPIMRDQNQGKIIQISSRSGFRPLPSLSVYAASKFALEGLSETMAALLKPWNISVTLVEPGPVNTELDFLAPYGSKLPRERDPYFALFNNAGLLDPVSPIAQQPEDIAHIVHEVIEMDSPPLRMQTTPAIKKLAALRLVDITGNSNVEEWKPILFPAH